jgi:hypothetical protein
MILGSRAVALLDAWSCSLKGVAMSARVTAALDDLVRFVTEHSPQARHPPRKAPPDRPMEAELSRLASELYAVCEADGIRIPVIALPPASNYKLLGLCQVPYWTSNGGLRIEATRQWLEAMSGLRRRAELHSEDASVQATSASATPTSEARDEGPATDEEEGWLRVKDAATIACVDPGVISKLASTGKLRSNGLTGSERRIWLLDLARRILRRAGRPERQESNDHVEDLVRRQVQE